MLEYKTVEAMRKYMREKRRRLYFRSVLNRRLMSAIVRLFAQRILEVPQALRRTKSESLEEKVIHALHEGQHFMHTMNTKVGIKACFEVDRLVKQSKDISNAWITTDSDWIMSVLE